MPREYDVSTDVGKVRLLINDINTVDVTYTDTAGTSRIVPEFIFDDSEIQALLDMEGAVKLAAAQALDTIADDQALSSKVLRSQDVSTDGAKLADSLRKRAAVLREQYYTGVALTLEADGGGCFTVEQYIPCPPELTESDAGRWTYPAWSGAWS